MLAMTYRAPFKVKMEQKAEPRLEHPNDCLVRVTRSTICGSDLHLYHGMIPDTRVGDTFGHEFAGIVQQVGSSVQNLKVGDRVVVPFNISCGACFFCAKGLTACCENTNPAATVAGGIFGYSHTTGGYDGGQAEMVRVPFADVGPMKIPDDMQEEDVLFLSDILPTGYQAAEMGQITEGDTVIVFGAGPVGLFAMKSAWLMGASRVIAVDFLDYRLEFARSYANAEPVNFRQVDDVLVELKKMTDQRGGDVVIDAVGCEADGSFLQQVSGVKLKMQAGASTSLIWSIEAARKGGTVVVIGAYGPPFNNVNIGTAMNKNLTIRAAQCNVKRYMSHLLEHIRAGRIDAKALITHRMPLEELPEGYRLFEKKQDNVLKIALIPSGVA